MSDYCNLPALIPYRVHREKDLFVRDGWLNAPDHLPAA